MKAIKHITLYVVIISLCYVLQCTLVKHIALANVCPNLMIIIPAIAGFLKGQREGIYVGFATGIVFDLFYCDIVGLNALIFLFIGFFAGFFQEHYNKDEIIIPLLVVLAGDFCYGFLNYVFNFLLQNKLDISFYMSRIIIPEIVYTLFVTIFVYKLVLFVSNLLGKKYERKVKRYVF